MASRFKLEDLKEGQIISIRQFNSLNKEIQYTHSMYTEPVRDKNMMRCQIIQTNKFFAPNADYPYGRCIQLKGEPRITFFYTN